MTRPARKGRRISGDGSRRPSPNSTTRSVIDTFGAPSAEAGARWARAKHRRGRPRSGRGARVISVSVERSLLERSDNLARRLDVSRARVARGLKAVLAAEGEI